MAASHELVEVFRCMLRSVIAYLCHVNMSILELHIEITLSVPAYLVVLILLSADCLSRVVAAVQTLKSPR